MKSQRNQLIILAALLIAWAVSWQLTVNKNRVPEPPPQPAAPSTKAASQ